MSKEQGSVVPVEGHIGHLKQGFQKEDFPALLQ